MARLTREEYLIVHHLIRETVRGRREYWRDLQDEILSWGSQNWYPAQAPFEDAATWVLQRLEPSKLERLIELAAGRGMDREQALRFYRAEVVERIVRRAESSALRRL